MGLQGSKDKRKVVWDTRNANNSAATCAGQVVGWMIAKKNNIDIGKMGSKEIARFRLVGNLLYLPYDKARRALCDYGVRSETFDKLFSEKGSSSVDVFDLVTQSVGMNEGKPTRTVLSLCEKFKEFSDGVYEIDLVGVPEEKLGELAGYMADRKNKTHAIGLYKKGEAWEIYDPNIGRTTGVGEESLKRAMEDLEHRYEILGRKLYGCDVKTLLAEPEVITDMAVAFGVTEDKAARDSQKKEDAPTGVFAASSSSIQITRIPDCQIEQKNVEGLFGVRVDKALQEKIKACVQTKGHRLTIEWLIEKEKEAGSSKVDPDIILERFLSLSDQDKQSGWWSLQYQEQTSLASSSSSPPITIAAAAPASVSSTVHAVNLPQLPSILQVDSQIELHDHTRVDPYNPGAVVVYTEPVVSRAELWKKKKQTEEMKTTPQQGAAPQLKLKNKGSEDAPAASALTPV